MTKPILVAVDPFREDPDPLSLATLLGERRSSTQHCS